jgi:hypothetical protein
MQTIFSKGFKVFKNIVSLNPFDNIQDHHPWNKIHLNKTCDKVMKIDKYDYY